MFRTGAKIYLGEKNFAVTCRCTLTPTKYVKHHSFFYMGVALSPKCTVLRQMPGRGFNC